MLYLRDSSVIEVDKGQMYFNLFILLKFISFNANLLSLTISKR